MVEENCSPEDLDTLENVVSNCNAGEHCLRNLKGPLEGPLSCPHICMLLVLIVLTDTAEPKPTRLPTPSSSGGDTAIPSSSSISIPVQSSTRPHSTSFESISTFSVLSTPQTSGSSSSTVSPSQTAISSSHTPVASSLQPSRTSRLPQSSLIFSQASLTASSPGSRPFSTASSFSSTSADPSSSSHSNQSESGSHGAPRKVVIALSASLGILLLAAVAALWAICLRRMYRRRHRRQSGQRAQQSDIYVSPSEVGSAKDGADIFQGNTSRDTHPSTAGHDSIVSPSAVPIPDPGTSIFVSPPPFLQGRRETLQHSEPLISPRSSSEERNGARAAVEPISESNTVQESPASPAPNLVNVHAHRSGVPGGSHFVTVLMEVPDEDECEMPPPYQPGSRDMHGATRREEAGTCEDE